MNGNATCAPTEDGCSVVDAGGDGEAGVAPKPLECTTYRVCNGLSNEDCCWSPSTGSTCKNDCEGNELSLCQDGDGCGYGSSCVRIDGDPLGAGVKRCVPDGWNGGGGSNGGWSSGSSNFGGF